MYNNSSFYYLLRTKMFENFYKMQNYFFFYNSLRTKNLKSSVELFFVFLLTFQERNVENFDKSVELFSFFYCICRTKPHRFLKQSYFSFFSCILEIIDLDRNSLYLETCMAVPLYILILDSHFLYFPIVINREILKMVLKMVV